MNPIPLSRYPLIHTSKVEELERAVAGVYGDTNFTLPRGAAGFRAVSSCFASSSALAVTYGSNGAAVRIRFPEFEYFGQIFSYGRSCDGRIGRKKFDVTDTNSLICNSHECLDLNFHEGFEQISIRFSADALTQHLRGMLGSEVVRPLKFDSYVPTKANSTGREFQNLVWRLIDEIDSSAILHSPIATKETEDTLLSAFLKLNANNYTKALSRRNSDVSLQQVKMIEEYIESNWDQPITVQALSVISGSSARTIFHSFKTVRGYSPMEFVRYLRLHQARKQLSSGSPSVSVTCVAYDCGFSNLGHFANYYLRQFGEKPSETLAGARGALRFPRGSQASQER